MIGLSILAALVLPFSGQHVDLEPLTWTETNYEYTSGTDTQLIYVAECWTAQQYVFHDVTVPNRRIVAGDTTTAPAWRYNFANLRDETWNYVQDLVADVSQHSFVSFYDNFSYSYGNNAFDGDEAPWYAERSRDYHETSLLSLTVTPVGGGGNGGS